jgi:hypothetical protein
VEACDGPAIAQAGAPIQLTLRLLNTGWLEWSSAPPRPVLVSYHWLDAQDRMVIFEGRRTPFAGMVGPHQEVSVTLDVDTPPTPGTYVLAIDLVRDGVTWFGEQGVPSHRVTVRID